MPIVRAFWYMITSLKIMQTWTFEIEVTLSLFFALFNVLEKYYSVAADFFMFFLS